MNWMSPVRSKSKKIHNQKSCKKDKVFFQSTQVTHEKELVLKTIEKQKEQVCTDSFNLSKFCSIQSKVLDSKLNSFMRQLEQFDRSDIYQSRQKQKLKISTSGNINFKNGKFNNSLSNIGKKKTKISQSVESFYLNCILKLKELCSELKEFVNSIKCSYESIIKETLKKVESDCTKYMTQYKSFIKNKIEKNVVKKYQAQLQQKVKKIFEYSQKNKTNQQSEEEPKVEYKILETSQTQRTQFPTVKQKIHKLMTPSKNTQIQTSQNKQKQGILRQRFIRSSGSTTFRVKQQVDRSSSKQLKKLSTHIKQLKDSFN